MINIVSDDEVITEYEYDAYGNQKDIVASDTNPFRYCGEYYDEESGLIYLRNRYYDPEIERFITEDPIQDGMNWYAYCANNPVMFTDPSGLLKKGDGKYGKVAFIKILLNSLVYETAKEYGLIDSMNKAANNANVIRQTHSPINEFDRHYYEAVDKFSFAATDLTMYGSGYGYGSREYSETVIGYALSYIYIDNARDNIYFDYATDRFYEYYGYSQPNIMEIDANGIPDDLEADLIDFGDKVSKIYDDKQNGKYDFFHMEVVSFDTEINILIYAYVDNRIAFIETAMTIPLY